MLQLIAVWCWSCEEGSRKVHGSHGNLCSRWCHEQVPKTRCLNYAVQDLLRIPRCSMWIIKTSWFGTPTRSKSPPKLFNVQTMRSLALIEGNFDSKFPTMWSLWTDGSARPGRNSNMKKIRSEKIRDGKNQRWRKSERKDAGARKGKKNANHYIFPVTRLGPGDFGPG